MNFTGSFLAMGIASASGTVATLTNGNVRPDSPDDFSNWAHDSGLLAASGTGYAGA